MFVTISITAGTLAIGAMIVAANSVMTWVSGVNARKRQKAQHEYEVKALREGHQAAMQQFQELCNVKKEIAEDEFKRNMELLKQQQQQSLFDVGYFSSLDEWPLQIPPMVMRNDNLFLKSNDENVSPNEVENMFSNIVMQIEPVHIIMSPCMDVSFRNSFHVKIEKKLSSFFEEYWGPSTMHPVIFYKQCWKDKTHDADGITVNNMHVKIPTIPTIIINPVVDKDSLRFETSFWNIFGDDRERNTDDIVNGLPISFPKDVYPFKSGMDYSERDQERLSIEIASFLMSMFSMLVDQYYWRRYRFAPHQPDVIKRHAISYSTQEIESLYTDYFQNLSETLTSSDIHPLIETDETLNYCKTVDVLSDKCLCFKEVLRSLSGSKVDDLNQLLLSLPFLNAKFFQSLISFCKCNQTLYSISNKTIGELQYILDFSYCKSYIFQVAKKEISDSSNQMPYDHYSCEETNAYKKIFEIIDSHRDSFWQSCKSFSYDIINKSRMTSKYTDKRNWARDKIEAGIEKMAEDETNSIIPTLYCEIKEAKRESVISFVNKIISDCQDEKKFDKKIIQEVSQLLKNELVELYVKDITWSPKKNWKNRPAYHFADKVVNVWIEYNFGSEDIVYKPSQVPTSSKEEIKKSFMDGIWRWNVVYDTEKALEDIFDGDKKSIPSYDDYSSNDDWSGWSFGDPITETFGIY